MQTKVAGSKPFTARRLRRDPDWKVNAQSARKLWSWFYDVQPGGSGPTRLKVMAPEVPLLLPPVKL